MIEDLLRISQKGENWAQIYNFSNYWVSDLGKVYSVKSHRLLKSHSDSAGYLLVSIHSDAGEYKDKRVHRLVAEAFLPNWNPEWPWTVNHINGIKYDNRLCNLEMLTTQDNNKHYQTAECFKESRKAARAAASAKLKEKCADPEYAAQMSDRMKEVWKDSEMRKMYIDCLYERQSHSENRKQVSDKLKQICTDPEYRRRMSERQKQNWNDPKYREAIMNSNQGRMWVHNEDSEKWIHDHELKHYIQDGYVEGRLKTNLKSSTAGRVRMHKGNQSRFILPEELTTYLQEGWSTGKADRKHVKCIETDEIFDSVEECARAFNTNTDLIHSRCKGTAKNFRKLKHLHFCYC